MTEKVTYRGCFIRYLDVRISKEGGEVFSRIHLSSEFTDTIREKMGWDDPGECVTSAKLSGCLLAQSFSLVPADRNLKRHALEIIISEVSDFEVVAMRDEESEIAGRQLRFIARSPGDGVAALIEQYIRRVGKHEGELRVSYEPQAKQTDLQLDQQPKVEPEKNEAPIASASTMGGTHQAKRKQGVN
jgi:hypothetical protein